MGSKHRAAPLAVASCDAATRHSDDNLHHLHECKFQSSPTATHIPDMHPFESSPLYTDPQRLYSSEGREL
jgi:hypothetical protein